MSNMIRLIVVAATLLKTGSALITSPAQGASWALNTEQEITWDTAGLVEPLELQLAPGNSTAATSYIQTVAPSIPNSGSWKWKPTTSIPQHSSFQIIIIDIGGKHQYSPPFQMIGWPQQPPSHQTPPSHQLPPVHTPLAPPPYVATPPPAHTLPPVHTPPPAHVMPPAGPSAILVTSLLVQTLIHTSQPHPIIKTIESPPLLQTENVAPIIVTQVQQPLTKIHTQPPQIVTEILQPIVKTILVTETPAPLIKTITQEPVTVIESQAPILITHTQAPIIKTHSQPPQFITEHLPPVVMTSEITQTLHLTSFVHPSQPPVHTPPPMHTSVLPPPPVHSSVLLVHSSAIITTPVESAPVEPTFAPVFPNTTLITTPAVNIPAFTTPLRLAMTSPGSASTSGLAGLPPLTFVGAASRSTVAFHCVSSVLIMMIALLW